MPEQAAALWNTVITNERNELAQTARKFIVALPRELTIAQNIELVKEYVASELTARGFVVDWVLHLDPDKAKEPNPHVHIMLEQKIGKSCSPSTPPRDVWAPDGLHLKPTG